MEKHKKEEKVKSQDNAQKDLIAQINEEKQKSDDLTDTLKRLQAEFENHKKRSDKEKAEFVDYANHEIIAKLLPTMDGFELALKNTSDAQKFIKGMEMIYAQLYSVLKSEGLRPIESLGKKFDPYMHDVLMKEESNKDEDIVLEELQKGYMLKDKVLRHSKVKVSCKKEAKDSGQQQ